MESTNSSTDGLKRQASQLFELILHDNLADPFINKGKLFNRIRQQLIVLHHTHQMTHALFQIAPQLDIRILYVSVSYHQLA